VKTGVQIVYNQSKNWIPASAGMTERRIFMLFPKTFEMITHF